MRSEGVLSLHQPFTAGWVTPINSARVYWFRSCSRMMTRSLPLSQKPFAPLGHITATMRGIANSSGSGVSSYGACGRSFGAARTRFWSIKMPPNARRRTGQSKLQLPEFAFPDLCDVPALTGKTRITYFAILGYHSSAASLSTRPGQRLWVNRIYHTRGILGHDKVQTGQ